MSAHDHRPPAAAVQPLERQLGAQEGAFDVHRYPSEAEAREAIEDREVYGASPAVAQLLTHAAAEQDAEVEDVVTTTPAASGLGSSVLPLVLAGIVTGVLAALAVSRGSARVGLTAAGSVLAGLSAALIADTWLGIGALVMVFLGNPFSGAATAPAPPSTSRSWRCGPSWASRRHW